ncbi:MAG TPA: hypothetical protein VKN64_10515 [Halanaerobiales bacterium]|nr:hypothetical protein [Halanaerobiales bacterium]
MLGEQTQDDDFANIDPQDGKDLKSDVLQNPSDPDAIYRFKYDNNIGYTDNVVEAFDGENNIIKNYDLEPNTYSNQKFSRDTIKTLSKTTERKKILKMLIGGTYFSIELAKEAIKEGIKLIPGELTGRKPDKNK